MLVVTGAGHKESFDCISWGIQCTCNVVEVLKVI